MIKMINKNMKKFFLLGLMVFMAFSISPVKAELINFTSPSVYTISYDGSQSNINRIKARYVGTNWYLSAGRMMGTGILFQRIAKFDDSEFEIKNWGFENLWSGSGYYCGGVQPCRYTDWIIYNNKIEVIGGTNGNTIGYWYKDLNNGTSHNRTSSKIYSTGNGVQDIVYANDGTVFFRRGTSPANRTYNQPFAFNNFDANTNPNILDWGNTWYLPTGLFPMTGGGSLGLTSTELWYIDSIDEYWLFFLNQTKSQTDWFLARFDGNYDYLSYTTACNDTAYGQILSGSSFLLDNIMYSVALNTTNSLIIKAWDIESTHNSNTFIQIDTQELNLTVYESSLNNENMATGVGLSHDGSKFWLFFNKNESTSDIIYAMVQGSACECSAWVNESCISSTYMKQTRQCSQYCDPEDSIQYLETDDCYEWFDPSKPKSPVRKKKKECYTGGCLGEWAYPLEVVTDMDSECYLDAYADHGQELLKMNQSEINYSISVHVDTYNFIGWSGHLGSNKYGMTMCNPLDECVLDNVRYLCESQTNMSQTAGKTYDTSLSVEDLQFGFIIGEGKQCAKEVGVSWFAQKYGWYRYRVLGSYSICGYRYCGDRRVCERSGLKVYSTQEMHDCQLNRTSRIECTSGKCKDGECVEKLEGEIRSPSGNPFEWIIGEAEYNLGTTMTMIMAIGGTFGIGVYAGIITKKWQISGMVMMGMSLLFMTLGWLPAIIGILWILGISVLLMKGLFFK